MSDADSSRTLEGRLRYWALFLLVGGPFLVFNFIFISQYINRQSVAVLSSRPACYSSRLACYFKSTEVDGERCSPNWPKDADNLRLPPFSRYQVSRVAQIAVPYRDITSIRTVVLHCDAAIAALTTGRVDIVPIEWQGQDVTVIQSWMHPAMPLLTALAVIALFLLVMLKERLMEADSNRRS